MKDNLVKQIYLLMEMQSFDGDVSHVHDSYKHFLDIGQLVFLPR